MKWIISALIMLFCLCSGGCANHVIHTNTLTSKEKTYTTFDWEEKLIAFPMPEREMSLTEKDYCYSVGGRLYRIGSWDYIGWYDTDTGKSDFISLKNAPYRVEMWGDWIAFIHKKEATAYLTDEKFEVQKIFTSPAVQKYLDDMEGRIFTPLWDFSSVIFCVKDSAEEPVEETEELLKSGLFLAKNGEEEAELIYPTQAEFDYCNSISESEMFLSYEYPVSKEGNLFSVKINMVFNFKKMTERMVPTKGEHYNTFEDFKNGNLYFKDGYYNIASQRFTAFRPDCDESGYVVGQNNRAYYFRDGQLFVYDFSEGKEITTNYRMPEGVNPDEQIIFWLKPDGSQLAFGSGSPQCNFIYLLEAREFTEE